MHQCSKILASRIQLVQDINFHGNLLKLLAHLVEAARKKSKIEAEYKELQVIHLILLIDSELRSIAVLRMTLLLFSFLKF